MDEEPMDEKLVKQINSMVDKMEDGKITKREFFRYLAGLGLLFTGITPFIRASTSSARKPNPQEKADLVRTGVLLKVVEQHDAVSGVLQGRVNPGAVGYAQVDTRGAWNFSISEGQALMKIGKEQAQFKGGEKVSISANDKVSFLNTGKNPWFFEATYWPNWHPDSIYYEFRGQQVPGREAWFELKTHAEDTVQRPMYHVRGWNSTPLNAGFKKQVDILKTKGIGVKPRPLQGTTLEEDYSGYCCDAYLAGSDFENTVYSPQDLALMDNGDGGNTSRRGLLSHKRRSPLQKNAKANYTFAEKNELDYRVITALSGEGILVIDGEPRRIRRGDSITIAPGVRQKLINDAGAPLLVEIRAQNPTYWHPDKSFVELTEGKFVPGHDVWFELVLPL